MDNHALRLLPNLELSFSDSPEHLFELDHLEEIEHLKMSGMRVEIVFHDSVKHFSLRAIDKDGQIHPLSWKAYPEG